MPPKFFITHSWKDIEFARRLFADLTAQGLEGWLDDKTVQGGYRLAEEINKGLEWCDVYIPILSRAALESTWCWEEINAAIALYNRRGRNNRPRIVSVLCENCQEEMPAVLAARLYFDFTDHYHDAFHELLTKGFGVSIAPPAPKVAVSPQPKVAIPPAPVIQTPPRTIINPKDNKGMIPIPAGEFVMGSNEGGDDEKPPHKVYLDAFYIARYPVTNAEYKKFVDATNRAVPFVEADWAKPYNWDKTARTFPADKADHPVVLVSWNDAVVYCKWAGARLPTEAEWEKAASWDDAKKMKRVYPWGDQFDASKCNTSESKINGTTPVGKYSLQGDSAFGVGDMAGNVWEWCADWYDENYYKNSPAQNPAGPNTGSYHVLRGGSWGNVSYGVRAAVRCALRGYPGRRGDLVGFRVVAGAS